VHISPPPGPTGKLTVLHQTPQLDYQGELEQDNGRNKAGHGKGRKSEKKKGKRGRRENREEGHGRGVGRETVGEGRPYFGSRLLATLITNVEV